MDSSIFCRYIWYIDTRLFIFALNVHLIISNIQGVHRKFFYNSIYWPQITFMSETIDQITSYKTKSPYIISWWSCNILFLCCIKIHNMKHFRLICIISFLPCHTASICTDCKTSLAQAIRYSNRLIAVQVNSCNLSVKQQVGHTIFSQICQCGNIRL